MRCLPILTASAICSPEMIPVAGNAQAPPSENCGIETWSTDKMTYVSTPCTEGPETTATKVTAEPAATMVTKRRRDSAPVRGSAVVRRDAGLLAGIGFPHADDMPTVAALRPDNDNHALTQIADRDNPFLAKSEAAIFKLDKRPLKNKPSLFEVEAAFAQGPIPLGGVKTDLHERNIVYTKNCPEAFAS